MATVALFLHLQRQCQRHALDAAHVQQRHHQVRCKPDGYHLCNSGKRHENLYVAEYANSMARKMAVSPPMISGWHTTSDTATVSVIDRTYSRLISRSR